MIDRVLYMTLNDLKKKKLAKILIDRLILTINRTTSVILTMRAKKNQYVRGLHFHMDNDSLNSSLFIIYNFICYHHNAIFYAYRLSC